MAWRRGRACGQGLRDRVKALRGASRLLAADARSRALRARPQTRYGAGARHAAMRKVVARLGLTLKGAAPGGRAGARGPRHSAPSLGRVASHARPEPPGVPGLKPEPRRTRPAPTAGLQPGPEPDPSLRSPNLNDGCGTPPAGRCKRFGRPSGACCTSSTR